MDEDVSEAEKSVLGYVAPNDTKDLYCQGPKWHYEPPSLRRIEERRDEEVPANCCE